MGLVHEVFTEENLSQLSGNLGVGHVRYSTAGGSLPENSQPLVIRYIKGTLMLAHNGNLVNTPELIRELSEGGAGIVSLRVVTDSVNEPTFKIERGDADDSAHGCPELMGGILNEFLLLNQNIDLRDRSAIRPVPQQIS